MKEKVLIFIVGLLVGIIISAGGFFIYTKISKTNQRNNRMNMEPPQMMQDENMDFKGKPEDFNNKQQESSDEKINGTLEDSSSEKSNKKNKQKEEINNKEST